MRYLTVFLICLLTLTACEPPATPSASPEVSAATKTTIPSPTETAPPTEAPATESPTVTETAPEPLEWPDEVGYSHFGQLVGDRPQVEFDGAWIRPHPGPFIWGEIEVRPGEYNWERVDMLVTNAQQQQLAILATVWPFAPWDQESCHEGQPVAQGAFPEFGNRLYAPCDMEAYTAWFNALVERYDGDGVKDMPGLAYPLRHWEILNEPAMQGPELTFFQESPEAYLEILKQSYQTVKATDPNAVVLAAGQAGMLPDFTDYWEPVLTNGKGYFDIGNIHSIALSDVFFAPEYRAWLDELGYESTPYWITEALVGRMVPPEDPQPSDDELAQLTLTGYASAFAHGAEVIFNVGGHDPTGGPGELSDQTFLLMARTIPDFTAATLLANNAVRFDLPDGRSVYALWEGASLPPEVAGPVNVITYTGDESQNEAETVSASVPMLVVAPSNE